MKIKNVLIFIILSFFFACQNNNTISPDEEKNWLIGKWKIDYEKTARSFLGKQSLGTVKKIIGDNIIEWTENEYIGPNVHNLYKITEISPSSITFEYNIGKFTARETWQRQGEDIYFEKPGRYIFYLKPYN